MNADDFVPFLGKLDGAPEIAKLLATLGVKKQPKLKKGDLYVYVQLPKDGVVLVFRESDDPKISQTFLAGVQLYSDAEDGFKTFAGDLPKGVTFDDTKTEVRKKLGKQITISITRETRAPRAIFRPTASATSAVTGSNAAPT